MNVTQNGGNSDLEKDSDPTRQNKQVLPKRGATSVAQTRTRKLYFTNDATDGSHNRLKHH